MSLENMFRPVVPESDREAFFAATIPSIREQLGDSHPGVVLDWKYSLYNPSTGELMDGAVEFLDFLQANEVEMTLVGKGAFGELGESMDDELDRHGLRDYFSGGVLFRDGDKEPSWYTEAVEEFHPGMIFVGDNPRSEIQVGNRMGAYTVRVRQGEFEDEEPQDRWERANYTVGSLDDARSVIAAMLQLDPNPPS